MYLFLIRRFFLVFIHPFDNFLEKFALVTGSGEPQGLEVRSEEHYYCPGDRPGPPRPLHHVL